MSWAQDVQLNHSQIQSELGSKHTTKSSLSPNLIGLKFDPKQAQKFEPKPTLETKKRENSITLGENFIFLKSPRNKSYTANILETTINSHPQQTIIANCNQKATKKPKKEPQKRISQK